MRHRLKILLGDLRRSLNTVSFYVSSVLRNFFSHDVFFYSSSLSFQVVLCLIPTVFLVIWILGTFLSPDTLLKQLEVISAYALPHRVRSVDEMRNLFLDRARIFTRHRGLFGILGIVGFFWTALALVSTLRKTVFHVLNIEISQSFLRQTLYDLRMLLIAGFFLTASTVVTTIFTGLREAAMQLPPGQMRFTLIRFGVHILSALGLTFLLYFSIYRFLSFGKIKSVSAAFGAFWAAVLFELAKNVFAIYISRIGNLGQVYGTLEVVVGLLLWIFYSTSVFILGVELANVHSMRRAAA